MLAWLAGLGILAWRTAQQYHQPPVPGRILGASLVFAGLGLLSEYQPAARFAAVTAWGFDVAVLFEVGPKALTSTAGFQISRESEQAHRNQTRQGQQGGQ